jgi:endoglucanase Acf2
MLLMFALPHHAESFSPQTASAATSVQLQTTTKGLATAVVADSWTMVESLPTTMGFVPLESLDWCSKSAIILSCNYPNDSDRCTK